MQNVALEKLLNIITSFQNLNLIGPKIQERSGIKNKVYFFFLNLNIYSTSHDWMPQAQHPEILANQMHERIVSQTGRDIFHNGSYL